MPTFTGIPTEYNGYKLRSRLEAKWAAFFDLLNWRWEYEPVDFNGWIPDFALYGTSGNIVYVEVKPVIQFPEDTAAKIDRSGCQEEVLIVGQTLPIPWNRNGFFASDLCTRFGWLRENSDFGWDEAVLSRWKTEGAGFFHAQGMWNNRMGEECGDSWKYLGFPPNEVSNLWARAANTVQWMPKRSTAPKASDSPPDYQLELMSPQLVQAIELAGLDLDWPKHFQQEVYADSASPEPFVFISDLEPGTYEITEVVERTSPARYLLRVEGYGLVIPHGWFAVSFNVAAGSRPWEDTPGLEVLNDLYKGKLLWILQSKQTTEEDEWNDLCDDSLKHYVRATIIPKWSEHLTVSPPEPPEGFNNFITEVATQFPYQIQDDVWMYCQDPEDPLYHALLEIFMQYKDGEPSLSAKDCAESFSQHLDRGVNLAIRRTGVLADYDDNLDYAVGLFHAADREMDR